MTSGSEPAPRRRTAVVTGGGRGIGRAVCLALARAGARVAPIARSGAELEETARAVAEAGGEAPDRPLTADVARYGEMEAAARRVLDLWGAPDVLVVAAGRALFKDVAAMSIAEWEREIAVNLTGAFCAVRSFLPAMIAAGRGDIVTLGSVASIKPFTGCGAYGASKFGLRGFTGALREELRPAGIRVTSILAGATETGIWGPELPAAAERLMRPEAVADAVVAAVGADPRSAVEEILIRPVLGDL